MAEEINIDAGDDEDAQALGCTARVDIRWAGQMSADDRADVAAWLNGVAEGLIADGHNYAAMFTAQLDPDE